MLKKRLSKSSATVQNLLKSGKALKKYLTCKECDKVDVEVAVDIAAVTCAYCVQRQVVPPQQPKGPVPEGERFPRGWALKTRYVHTDGRVFEKGKDTGQTETTEVKKKSEKKVAKKTKVKKPTKRSR